MNTLILNKTNVTAQANTFQYNFIGSGYEIKPGSKIAISSITIPYSWFNVTTNNRLGINWPDYATGINIIYDPGFYTVDDLQYFLEQKMIDLGMYLIDGTGKNVYYMKMIYNVVYYSVQVLLYPVPTSLPAGYSQPANFIGYALSTACMTFTIVANNSIGSIIGFSTGTYGIGATSKTSFLSNLVPIGSSVNSVIVRATICDNPVVNPTDILDSFPITSSFGENINYVPSTMKFIKAKPGRYSNLIISFFDEKLNPLAIRDPNLLITLLLKEA
jgi:hypothetical protein